MKLNPSKCAFRVSTEKFLGFMVKNRGIEVNPDKIKVVLDMYPPSNTKEIQRLTGRIAALSCFVSRSSDKCPGSEKGFPLGRPMRKGVLGAQNIPELLSRLGKSLRGRTPHPLLGRFRFFNQRRPGQRAR